MSYPQPPAWASDILTVGVTGTNGKTSTTRWVAKALLRTDPYAVAIHTLGHSIAGKSVQARLDFDGFLGVMKRGWQRGTSLAAIELSSLALAHGCTAWRHPMSQEASSSRRALSCGHDSHLWRDG